MSPAASRGWRRFEEEAPPAGVMVELRRTHMQPPGQYLVSYQPAGGTWIGATAVVTVLPATDEWRPRDTGAHGDELARSQAAELKAENEELRRVVMRVYEANVALKRFQEREYDDDTQRFCDEIEFYASAGYADAELMKLAERFAEEEQDG